MAVTVRPLAQQAVQRNRCASDSSRVSHRPGRDPGRTPAGTVDIQQPAAAAVVGESGDVIERAQG